jgi:hypothetical protein
MPPYLAGRTKEKREFQKLLEQSVILENFVLTGLRGVGKTVLLDTLRPAALEAGWLWAGTDMSESASISEEATAVRLITDLSVVTSSIEFRQEDRPRFGFSKGADNISEKLNYQTLIAIFTAVPGLLADKLKTVLEFVWACMEDKGAKGIVFAYDEAQTMSDHAQKDEYPLSLLLDVFQSIQKKSIPFMLVLSGLPTLFPKLVEARTFAERMFTVVFLDSLDEQESRDAITEPLRNPQCLVFFSENVIDLITKVSGGYPYFIQFICKELYDIIAQGMLKDNNYVPLEEITRKLDNDFFAGRWARATDRQRQLMYAIASLPNCDREFSVQEIVEASRTLDKPFSSSHVNQMLSTLINMGMVYKNRHGKYSFAVPLLGRYIRRQQSSLTQQGHLFQ